MSPNHSAEVQWWALVALGETAVEDGMVGGDVMACDRVVVVTPVSWQPQK
jgi:hypothetical protein